MHHIAANDKVQISLRWRPCDLLLLIRKKTRPQTYASAGNLHFVVCGNVVQKKPLRLFLHLALSCSACCVLRHTENMSRIGRAAFWCGFYETIGERICRGGFGMVLTRPSENVSVVEVLVLFRSDSPRTYLSWGFWCGFDETIRERICRGGFGVGLTRPSEKVSVVGVLVWF